MRSRLALRPDGSAGTEIEAAAEAARPVDRRDDGHDHDHPKGRAAGAGRSFGSSLWLASAIDRMVVAVVVLGLMWIGVVWAVA